MGDFEKLLEVVSDYDQTPEEATAEMEADTLRALVREMTRTIAGYMHREHKTRCLASGSVWKCLSPWCEEGREMLERARLAVEGVMRTKVARCVECGDDVWWDESPDPIHTTCLRRLAEQCAVSCDEEWARPLARATLRLLSREAP